MARADTQDWYWSNTDQISASNKNKNKPKTKQKKNPKTKHTITSATAATPGCSIIGHITGSK